MHCDAECIRISVLQPRESRGIRLISGEETRDSPDHRRSYELSVFANPQMIFSTNLFVYNHRIITVSVLSNITQVRSRDTHECLTQTQRRRKERTKKKKVRNSNVLIRSSSTRVRRT